jgi:hypothetical protein
MKNCTAIASIALLALAFSSCMSIQNGGTLDQLANAIASPIVEAYVEYPGPHAKWAGPASFVMHVDARGTGIAKLTVVPSLVLPAHHTEGRVANRVLASVKDETQEQGLSAEAARQHLGNLASTLGQPESTFKGCLAPVRVRLIRANGALIERQGCRGQSGWTKAASETVNRFVTAHLHGPNAPLTSTVVAEIEQ